MTMFVVPDANIMIADPWLRSQRWRVLINYLARTASRLVLLPAVENEVRSHIRRSFDQSISTLASALNHARRQGLSDLPDFDADRVRAHTRVAWDRVLAEALGDIDVERPPLPGGILPEALRRAAERIPPCDENGQELRDTIIWLCLLDHCRALPEDATVAFVSLNTRDFAGSDAESLRPELLEDVAALARTINYFPSLEAFNKAHADRVAYLTVDWVQTHLGNAPVQELVAAHLLSVEPAPYISIVSSEYADYYEPRTTLTVDFQSLTIDDVHVWRTLPNELELRIDFSVDVEADAECELMHRPSYFYRREFNDEFDDNFPSAKSLNCMGELSGVIAARIINDQHIEVSGLEELQPR